MKFIVGLDGLPYELFKKLVEKGIFKNVGKLLSTHRLSKVESSIPEVSNVAWASVITGRNPGEHGIFGFVELDRESYRLRFPNFMSLKEKPFWEALGLKTAAINIPGTYPARPMKGVMVSGFVAVDLEKATYPRSFYELLRSMDYRIDVDSSKGHRSKSELLEDAFSVLDRRAELLLKVWGMDSWDVLFFVFTETDRVMHFLWDEIEDEDAPLHNRCMEFFARIDDAVGKVLELSSKEQVFFLSDHGFEALDFDVNINAVLEKEGFLAFEGERKWSCISPSSKAFSLEPARIYIHDGRFSRGKVKNSGKVLEELLELFSSLELEGKKVVRSIFKGEDIYKGPYIDEAPDLVLIPSEGFNLRSSLNYSSVFSKPVFTGKHTHHNAFILHPTSQEPENIAQFTKLLF